MKISTEKLRIEAENTGFRPEILEKVALLLGLLEAIETNPWLKGKLALKGGTALNVFLFAVPRLSVDIDLNYIGTVDREAMLADRPKIERAIRLVCEREDFTITRLPEEHAGGKWLLRYENAFGQNSNLELDINFMFRLPLWPVVSRNSYLVGSWQARGIPVLDQNELAAGKLAALLARGQARDLFDSYQIFQMNGLDQQKLREKGIVDATILTADAELQKRIQKQPLLEWKAFNIKKNKGLI